MENVAYREVREMVRFMRRNAIEMAFTAGKKGAHLGGALSAVEIIACLYSGIMQYDSKNPAWDGRDYFIPSKAHCVLAFYTALAYCGFFSTAELKTFEENDSDLSGHPVMNLVKGIEFSGGSLGMGLSQGVGIALHLQRQQKENYVFVLLGDGECDEGSIWEAAMAAANFRLGRLIVIIDRNHLQYDGQTEQVMPLGNLRDKFSSFGFVATEVDGHDIAELYSALERLKQMGSNSPKLVIADTVKGKGISFMENKPEWHHATLSKEQYEMAMMELEVQPDDN